MLENFTSYFRRRRISDLVDGFASQFHPVSTDLIDGGRLKACPEYPEDFVHVVYDDVICNDLRRSMVSLSIITSDPDTYDLLMRFQWKALGESELFALDCGGFLLVSIDKFSETSRPQWRNLLETAMKHGECDHCHDLLAQDSQPYEDS